MYSLNMKARAYRPLLLGLGFCAAFCAALVSTDAKSAAAAIDECTANCGPAPCCEVLWTTWCGCWWGEEGEIQ